MAQPTKEQLENLWAERVRRSTDHYKKWEEDFKARTCEQYYEGKQWLNTPNVYSPYVINLVFSTIEVKLPNLVFTEPIAQIKPKPGRESWNSEAANADAQLKEDIVNAFATDPDNCVPDEIELAILDSFFRFGIIEVGFSADWVDNPNAGKPWVKDDGSVFMDGENQVIKEPDKLPVSEQNYIKRIPARNFRVGGIDNYKLERCSWCGYWEFVALEELKANKNLKTDEISYSGNRSADFVYLDDEGNEQRQGDLVRLWHIWDNRAKVKYIFSEDHMKILAQEKFDRLPLFPLIFHKRTRGFYPMPPVSNWLSPQNEINESREMQRIHRRRFTRKYFYDKNKIPDQQDIDKLENGPDGTFIGIEGDPNTAAAPLQNADLGASLNAAQVVSKDDFNIVSGTSAEQRGQADRQTATQSNIINERTAVRETRYSGIVARWISAIFREVLLQMKEKNVLPYWIEKTQGEFAEQTIWQQILLQESLEDFDFEVRIDIAALSPQANDDREKGFLKFLAVLKENPQLAMSPDLVQEAANIFGYRNRKVLKQMMEMAQLAMIGQIEQGKQAVQGAMSQRTVQQATPPEPQQINNQVANLAGLPQ